MGVVFALLVSAWAKLMLGGRPCGTSVGSALLSGVSAMGLVPAGLLSVLALRLAALVLKKLASGACSQPVDVAGSVVSVCGAGANAASHWRA